MMAMLAPPPPTSIRSKHSYTRQKGRSAAPESNYSASLTSNDGTFYSDQRSAPADSSNPSLLIGNNPSGKGPEGEGVKKLAKQTLWSTLKRSLPLRYRSESNYCTNSHGSFDALVNDTSLSMTTATLEAASAHSPTPPQAVTTAAPSEQPQLLGGITSSVSARSQHDYSQYRTASLTYKLSMNAMSLYDPSSPSAFPASGDPGITSSSEHRSFLRGRQERGRGRGRGGGGGLGRVSILRTYIF